MNRFPRHPLVHILALLLLPTAPALGAEHWDSFVRPIHYTALLAAHDTVWCGTREAGLLLYCRATDAFTTWTKQPNGISSNKVTALALDRQNRLWVGTEDGGVSLLENDRRTWGLLNQLDGLPSTSITCLRAMGDSLWIGTDNGLALWNGQEISGRVPDGVNGSPFVSNRITGIVPVGDSLWVATDSCIYVSRFSSQLQDWVVHTPTLSGRHTIGTLVWDGAALMTVVDGTTAFVYDFAGGSWMIQPVYPAGGPHSIGRLSDMNGVILATTTGGLFRWDASSGWVLVTDQFPSGMGDSQWTYVATVDAAGIHSIANFSGLRLEDAFTHVWALKVPPHPPSNSIANVLLDGDYVYVGTEVLVSGEGGAGRFDGRDWRLWEPGTSCAPDTCIQYPGWCYAMMLDRHGKKWIANWPGSVDEFDDFADPPNFIHHWMDGPSPNLHTRGWGAALDSAGGHWFGMETDCDTPGACDPLGLDYYDAGGTWRASFGPSYPSAVKISGKVHSLTVDAEGYVWVGCVAGGLLRFQPPDLQHQDAPVITPLRVDSIPSTCNVEGLAARGEYVWALTNYDNVHGSLIRIHWTTGMDTTRYEVMNVTSLAMHAIDVGPDGSVWVGSTGGLRRFPAPPTPHRFVDYNTSNSPILSDEVRAVRVDQRTGVVWIGTSRGLSRLDPNYIPPVSAPPTLDLRVYPNPAMISGGGMALRLAKRSTGEPGGVYRGAVYDVSGRRLCEFQVNLDAPQPPVFWDGRDSSGRLARSGIYFVRVEAGGRAGTMRIALVR